MGKRVGWLARLPPLPPDHPGPGSLAPNIGDHGPSDSALAAASGWRLRRPAADRHRRAALLGHVLGRAPIGAMRPRAYMCLCHDRVPFFELSAISFQL